MQDFQADEVFIHVRNERMVTIRQYCLHTKQLMRVRTTVTIRLVVKTFFSIKLFIHSTVHSRRGDHHLLLIFAPLYHSITVLGYIQYFEIQHYVSSKINFCNISSSSRLPSGITIASTLSLLLYIHTKYTMFPFTRAASLQ